MRLAALLVLAAFAGLAQAREGNACAQDIEAALRAVDRKAGIRGDVAASDCRPWPSAPGGVMAAVMAFEKPGSGKNSDLAWEIIVALVDLAGGKALNSHRITLQEDATTLLVGDSLSLDLAPYLLKPGVRALGLRFSSARTASAANSSTDGALRLYVPDGPRLWPVFCQAMGWQDAGDGVIGQQPWNEAQTTLSVLTSQTSGWHDLRLTDRISHQTPDGEASKPRPSHRECRFSGGIYRCERPRSQALTDCDPAGL
jgi:hypothetical protein